MDSMNTRLVFEDVLARYDVRYRLPSSFDPDRSSPMFWSSSMDKRAEHPVRRMNPTDWTPAFTLGFYQGFGRSKLFSKGFCNLTDQAWDHYLCGYGNGLDTRNRFVSYGVKILGEE